MISLNDWSSSSTALMFGSCWLSWLVPMMKVTVEMQTMKSEVKARAWAPIEVSGYSRKFHN